MAAHAQWAPWRLLLCAAIIAGSVVASLWTILRRKNRRAATGGAGATAAWSSSCWSGVHPAWLLASRLSAAVALAVVLLWDVRTYGPSIMVYYYTEWTILLEIVYFVVATLFSAYGCLTHARTSSSEAARADVTLLCDDGDVTNCKAGGAETGAGRYLGCFMQIAYQVCGGAVVLTDVVFWALIVPFMKSARFSLNAVMCCMHSLNLVLLLIETALNSLAFPLFRITHFILWTCSYVIVQWIAHICGLTWWPYPFLNPTALWAPLWYFALALLHFPCYILYWSIARAKNWCHTSCGVPTIA